MRLTDKAIKSYRGFNGKKKSYTPELQENFKSWYQNSLLNSSFKIEVIDNNLFNNIVNNGNTVPNFSYCKRIS